MAKDGVKVNHGGMMTLGGMGNPYHIQVDHYYRPVFEPMHNLRN